MIKVTNDSTIVIGRILPVIAIFICNALVVTGLGGCSSVSWPVDRPDHRIHQGYGNYQGNDAHNGIDAVGSGDGPQTGAHSPYGIADLLAVADNLRLVSCGPYGTGDDHDPDERELQPSFRRVGHNQWSAYGHAVEFSFAGPDYEVLWRHAAAAGDVPCINYHAANESAIDAGSDDYVNAVAGVIMTGADGICQTRIGGDDEYIVPFYYLDGGGATLTTAQYNALALEWDKGERFGRISLSWGPATNRPGAHTHFAASTDGDINQPDPLTGNFYEHTQNPLRPASHFGHDGGYDPSDNTPEVGPLIVKEKTGGGLNEVSPDPTVARPVPYAEGELELVVEVIDRGGGEQKAWGAQAQRNEAEANSWWRDLSRTDREEFRWAGIAAAPLRTEYWIEGRSYGLGSTDIASSSEPQFIEWRGEMFFEDTGGVERFFRGRADWLYDASAGRTSGLQIPAYAPFAGLWTNSVRLTSIVRSGYLRDHGVAGGDVVRLHDDGIWNTKAGDTSADREWNHDTHGTDAEFPAPIRNTTHPGWEFPDGVYRLHVKAKDPEDRSASDQWDIRVDNWAPRIVKLKLESKSSSGLGGTWRTVYEYDWLGFAASEVAAGRSPAYPTSAAADLFRRGLRGYLAKEGRQIRLTIQFSEPMDTSTSWAGVAAPYVNVSYGGQGEHDVLSYGSWSDTVYEDDTLTISFSPPSDVASVSGALPDMQITVRARDLVHKTIDADCNNTSDTEDANHVIDFKPRLEKIVVYQGGTSGDDIVYSRLWELNTAQDALALSSDQVTEWVNYEDGDVVFKLFFSEPMADSPSIHLLKRDGTYATLGNLDVVANTNHLEWESSSLLSKSDLGTNDYHGKEEWLRIIGNDRDTNADTLDGLPGTVPLFNLSSSAWEKYEDENGNGASGGRDKQHALKIETKAPEVSEKKP